MIRVLKNIQGNEQSGTKVNPKLFSNTKIRNTLGIIKGSNFFHITFLVSTTKDFLCARSITILLLSGLSHASGLRTTQNLFGTVPTESLPGTRMIKYPLVSSSVGKMKVNTESSNIIFKPFVFMFLPN